MFNSKTVHLSIHLLALISVVLFASMAMAGSTDTVALTYEVTAIDEINLDNATETMTVSSATAGAAPDQASTAGTWDITTNGTNKKITAAIDTNMPSEVTLQINMTAPAAAGTSAGATTISATAADLVTGMETLNEADIVVGYTLDATVDAGVVASASKTVTFTITDGA